MYLHNLYWWREYPLQNQLSNTVSSLHLIGLLGEVEEDYPHITTVITINHPS